MLQASFQRKSIHLILTCLLATIACKTITNFTPQQKNNFNQTESIIPSDLQVIGPDNVSKLDAILSLGSGRAYDLAWSPDQAWLGIATSNGINIYEFESGQLLRTLPGTNTKRNRNGAVAISPDGKLLVSTSSEASGVIIWDTQTWGKLHIINEGGGVHQIIFSPDGKLLAYSVGSTVTYLDDNGFEKIISNNNIYIVNVDSGEIIYLLPGGLSIIRAIVFSPDGNILASSSCCDDSEDAIRLWNVVTGKEVHNIDSAGFSAGLYSVLSPDGLYQAIAYDGGISIFEVGNGNRKTSIDTDLAVQEGWDRRTAFSPDGKMLTILSDDAEIWNLEEKPPLIKTFQAVDGSIFAASPNGSQLAMAGINGELRLFDVNTGDESILSSGPTILALTFSTGGDLLAISRQDGTIELWEMKNLQLRMSLKDTDAAEQLEFEAMDSLLISSNGFGKSIIWDSLTGDRRWEISSNPYLFQSYFLSKDGNFLVVAKYQESLTTSSLDIYSISTGAKLGSISLPDPYITSFVLTSDAKTLIISSINGNQFEESDLIFYDLENKKETQRISAGSEFFRMILVDEEQSLALVGDEISLWDTVNRIERYRFPEISETLFFGGKLDTYNERFLLIEGEILLDTWTGILLGQGPISVSMKENIFSRSEENTIILANLEGGEEFLRFTAHTNDISELAFLGDETLLASGSVEANEIKLWEVSARNQVSQLEYHNREGDIAFSPDHSTLIYAHAGALRFIDLSNGKDLYPLDGELAGAGFSGLAFTPDGNYFISSNYDQNNIMIWEAKTRKLLHTFRVGRGLLEGIAISPDSHTLAIVEPEIITLIDLATWSVTSQINTDIERGYLTAFSSDSKKLVTTDFYGDTSIWDMVNGNKLYNVNISGGMVKAAAISPNGEWLAVVVDESEMQVWSVESGKEVWSFQDPDQYYDSGPSTFSPDGRLLATATAGGGLTIWESATGKQIYVSEAYAAFTPSIAFSPDGMLLAISVDGTIKLLGVK